MTLLDFKTKVFLGVVCRGLLKENLFEIVPYDDSNVKLTPGNNLLSEIYNNLIENNIIVVNPNSRIEAFKECDDFPNIYYTYFVEYNLNINYEGSKQYMIDQLLKVKSK